MYLWLWPYACSVAVGIASLSSAACNAIIGVHVHSPLLGAAVAFCLGSCLLMTAVLLTAPVGSGAFECAQRRPYWWELMGGVCGALYLTTVVTSTTILGAAHTFALVVTGQLLSSVLIDSVGLMGGTPIPLTVVRVLGVAAAGLGATLAAHSGDSTRPHGKSDAASTSTPHFLLLAATAAAGALQPLQAALNARLASLLGGDALAASALVSAVPNPLQAITISFCISAVITSTFSVIFVKREAWAALPSHLLELPKLAALIGAPAQALVLLGGAIIPKKLGTASYYTLLIAGEMFASLSADSLGILGLEQRALTLARASGVVLIVGAAATLTVDTHQKPPSPVPSLKLESSV